MVDASQASAEPRAESPAAVIVDLDDRESEAGARAMWSPSQAVLIGVTECSRALSGAAGALADRLSLTLGPTSYPRSDRRVVASAAPRTAAHRVARRVEEGATAALTVDSVLRLVADLPSVQAGVVTESYAYSMLLAGKEFRAWRAQAQPRPVPRNPDECISVVRKDNVLQIVLNDPARRNAFSAALRAGLVEALAVAEWDNTVSVVELSGAGTNFSSGGDLDEFGCVTDPPTGHAIRLAASPGLAVHAVRDRVVARLHGACVGAGVEVPAFARRVVAAPGTTFRLPEVGMGLIPGAGGTVSISRRIGRWRTAYLCLTGEVVDTAIALEWGLIDAIG